QLHARAPSALAATPRAPRATLFPYTTLFRSENGVEKCRARVTLATGIPREMCGRINLGYRDPASIRIEDFADREKEGILLVPKRSEEHTSELQSRFDLVCRLLLEKKNKTSTT